MLPDAPSGLEGDDDDDGRSGGVGGGSGTGHQSVIKVAVTRMLPPGVLLFYFSVVLADPMTGEEMSAHIPGSTINCTSTRKAMQRAEEKAKRQAKIRPQQTRNLTRVAAMVDRAAPGTVKMVSSELRATVE